LENRRKKNSLDHGEPREYLKSEPFKNEMNLSIQFHSFKVLKQGPSGKGSDHPISCDEGWCARYFHPGLKGTKKRNT